MSDIQNPLADGTITEKEKQAIRNLMFRRVSSNARRQKIIRVASELGDPIEEDDDFWAAIYYYSLKENWIELDEMFKLVGRDMPSFIGPSDLTETPLRTKKSKKKSKRRS